MSLQRFAQVTVKAETEESLFVALKSLCGQRNNRMSFRAERLPDDASCIDPAQVGHLNIHKDQIVLDLLDSIQRPLAVDRQIRTIPESRKHQQTNLLIYRVILGQQNPKRMVSRHGAIELFLGDFQRLSLEAEIVFIPQTFN